MNSLACQSWLCILRVILGQSCYSALSLAKATPHLFASPALSLSPSPPPPSLFLLPATKGRDLHCQQKLSAFMTLLVCVC